MILRSCHSVTRLLQQLSTLLQSAVVCYDIAADRRNSSRGGLSSFYHLFKMGKKAGVFIWHIQNKKALRRGPKIINQP